MVDYQVSRAVQQYAEFGVTEIMAVVKKATTRLVEKRVRRRKKKGGGGTGEKGAREVFFAVIGVLCDMFGKDVVYEHRGEVAEVVGRVWEEVVGDKVKFGV